MVHSLGSIPPPPDYPKVEKGINREYYFTQEEYGWVPTNPGKHLNFYRKRKFWFAKEVGHIQWQMSTGDINAKLIDNASPNLKRLILTENNKVVLDTTLPLDKGFDFSYYPR